MKEFRTFIQERFRAERVAAHESGHATDEYPEIEVFVHPDWLEQVRRQNAAYNDSVTREWEEIDPAEDYRPDVISRIGPDS